MMTNWRPNGWENPYGLCEGCNDCHWSGDNCDGDYMEHEAYEHGADAMLEALREEPVSITRMINMVVNGGAVVPSKSDGEYYQGKKGVFVFIPDKEGE